MSCTNDVSLNIVAVKHKGTFVAQIPLLNFRTFYPEGVKGLVEISETEKNCWKFHYYDASALCTQLAVKNWASWLVHRDMRAVVKHTDHLSYAFDDAMDMDDTDYQDALVDAWMDWLQDGQPTGRLSVYRIRSKSLTGTTLVELHSCLHDLGKALILHHDAEAGMINEQGGERHYRDSTCKTIRELAQKYFSKTEREPKDPLQLSADEFCRKYHSHHKKNRPCHKTKKLPEQTSSD